MQQPGQQPHIQAVLQLLQQTVKPQADQKGQANFVPSIQGLTGGNDPMQNLRMLL